MAEMLLNPTVGALAYPAYSPQQAGVIVALVPAVQDVGGLSHLRQPGVRIRMLNGREVETASPMDLVALVEEHRRKADKFATLARSLQSMAVAEGIVTR